MSVNIPIRWSDNTKELAANLKEGTGQIEATRAAAEKMAASLGGDKLIRAAHTYVAALSELGQGQGALAGAAKLTAAELDRGNALLDKAITKYTALGQSIPPAIVELQAFITAQKEAAKATDKSNTELDAMAKGMTAAAKTSVDSARMIAGMSESGRAAAAGVTKADASVGSFITSLKSLNGLLATFGVGLGVGTFLGIAKSVLADADALTNLSDKTDLSVDTLQRLQIATDDSGNSLDDLAGAVNKMQKNFGSRNEGAIAAVAELGLNFEKLSHLNTEEKLYEIAAALAQVEDADKQVALGTAIMGKSFAEVLPTIKRGFDDVKDAAPDMARETIRALADVDDAWQRLQRRLKGGAGTAAKEVLQATGAIGSDADLALESATIDAMKAMEQARRSIPKLDLGAIVTPGLPANLKELDKAWGEQSESLLKAARATEEYQRKLEAINKKIREAIRDIGHLTDAQQDEAIALDKLGLSTDEIGFKIKASGEAVKRFLEVNADLDKAIARITTHVSAQAIPAFKGLILTWQQMLNTGRGLTYDGLIPIAKGFDDVARAELAAKVHADDLEKSQKALQGQLARTMDLMPDLSQVAREHMKGLTESTKEGKSEVEKLGEAFEQLGRMIGGAMGNSVAALGYFIKEFKKAKKESEKIANAIEGSIVLAGMFTAPGTRGSNVASFAGAGASLGTAIMPGYGTAIGAGVGALVGALRVPENEKNAREAFKAFERQVGSIFQATATSQHRVEASGDAWNTMLIQIREAYLATGRTAEQALADITTATLHTREQLELLPDDLAKINQALQEQQQDQVDLVAAIEKYGFTLEELGPAFRKQELTKQALGLENAFRLLVDAGADVHLVIDRMGEDLNAFLQMAMKTGTEVPAEMRPIIEEMIAMGKLTDANGEAFTDLASTGITFSETMTQGFDRIVTALEKVLKALGYIDEAVAAIPDDKTIRVHTETDPALDQLLAGGGIPLGIQDPGFPVPDGMNFAAGSGGFRDFGAGSIAVLHGREAVVREDQFLAGTSGLTTSAAGSAPEVHYHTWAIDVHAIDGTDLRRKVEHEILPMVIDELEDNRRGTSRRMSNALRRAE